MGTTDPRSKFDANQLVAEIGDLRRLARHLMPDDTAAADDLVQDVLLCALRHPPRAGWSVRSWLRGMARNVLRGRQRSEARRARREERACGSAGGLDPCGAAALRELERRLAERVRELEEPYRTVIELRFFEQQSAAAIGRLMGVPPSTVRSWSYRALDRLRLPRDRARRRDLIGVLLLLTHRWRRVASRLVMRGHVRSVAAVVLAVGIWFLAQPGADVPERPRERDVSQDAVQSEMGRVPVPVPVPVTPASSSPSTGAQQVRGEGFAWVVAGRLRGLHPESRWSSEITVRPARDGGTDELPEEVSVPVLPDGSFTADISSLRDQLGKRGAVIVAADDPAYLASREFVPLADCRGRLPVRARFEVEIPVCRAAVIQGRVRDQHGAPLEGVQILGRAAHDTLGGPHLPWAVTESDGSFRLRLGVEGRTSVVASHADMGSVRALATVALGRETELPDLTLLPGLGIQGTVVARDGQPMAGIKVVARPAGSLMSKTVRSAVTTKSGQFELSALAPVAHEVSLADWPGAPLTVTPPATNVCLGLDAARVTWTVKQGGSPAAGAQVEVAPSSQLARDQWSWPLAVGTCDALGEVELPLQPGQSYDCCVTRAGAKPSRSRFAVPAGAIHHRREEHLQPEQRAGPLTIALREGGGEPFAGWIWVLARSVTSAASSEQHLEASDGAIELVDLAREKYEIIVRAGADAVGTMGHYRDEVFTVDLRGGAASTRELALEAGGRLQLRVLDRVGHGLRASCQLSDRFGRSVPVTWCWLGEGPVSLVPDLVSPWSSSCSEPALPPGDYELRVTMEGFAPHIEKVEILPLATTKVSVTLERQ